MWFRKTRKSPKGAKEIPPADIVVREFVESGRWGADTVRRMGRQLTPTGRWICVRCRCEFRRAQDAEAEWWTQKAGPHVCPDCGSYAFTVPIPKD
jgi:hypothetical protein